MAGESRAHTNTVHGLVRLTPPYSWNGSGVDVLAGTKLFEDGRRKTFGEDVGVLQTRRHMKNASFSQSDVFPNKMKVNLNMLRPLMLDGISQEVDRTDVVTEDNCSLM